MNNSNFDELLLSAEKPSRYIGAEVNAASKLGEDTAEAWEILVTGSVKNMCSMENIFFEKLDEAPAGADEAFRILLNK